MADQKIIEYITKTKEMGFSNDRIRQALLKAGHDESEVNKAFEQAFPSASPLEVLANKKVMISLILIASIFSLSMLVQVFFKTTEIAGQSMNHVAGYVTYEPEEKVKTALTIPEVKKHNYKDADCTTFSGSERDWCIYTNARARKDSESCRYIKSSYVRDFCIGTLNQNIDCGLLADPTMKKGCQRLSQN